MGKNNYAGSNADAQAIQVITDAYGITSVHNNLPKQSYQESMLGWMACEGENDDWYFYIIEKKEKIGPFDNYEECRRNLIKAVNGYVL